MIGSRLFSFSPTAVLCALRVSAVIDAGHGGKALARGPERGFYKGPGRGTCSMSGCHDFGRALEPRHDSQAIAPNPQAKAANPQAQGADSQAKAANPQAKSARFRRFCRITKELRKRLAKTSAWREESLDGAASLLTSRPSLLGCGFRNFSFQRLSLSLEFRIWSFESGVQPCGYWE